MKNVFIVKWK